MRKSYCYLLLLIMLTLPFRGMAALVMPVEGAQDAQHMIMGQADGGCEHMHETSQAPAGDHTCSHCADCCSMAMAGPAILLNAIAFDLRATIPSLRDTPYLGFHPDSLDRPPRLLTI